MPKEFSQRPSFVQRTSVWFSYTSVYTKVLPHWRTSVQQPHSHGPDSGRAGATHDGAWDSAGGSPYGQHNQAALQQQPRMLMGGGDGRATEP